MLSGFVNIRFRTKLILSVIILIGLFLSMGLWVYIKIDKSQQTRQQYRELVTELLLFQKTTAILTKIIDLPKDTDTPKTVHSHIQETAISNILSSFKELLEKLNKIYNETTLQNDVSSRLKGCIESLKENSTRMHNLQNPNIKGGIGQEYNNSIQIINNETDVLIRVLQGLIDTINSSMLHYFNLPILIMSLLVILLSIISYKRYISRIIQPLKHTTYRISQIIHDNNITETRDKVEDITVYKFCDRISSLIKYNADAVTEIQEKTTTLIEYINDMCEVLDFLSNKADEQHLAAEEDLVSINNISAMMSEISNGSEDQQMNLGILIVRIIDFTKIVETINNNLSNQISMINNISTISESGNECLKQMTESMTKISASSIRMTDVIKLIHDISDQINLLSLNAAIESARAGEHGRGFAVVADEISNLAEETANSIQEIDSLIRENEIEIKNGLARVTKTVESITSVNREIGLVKEIMVGSYDKMEDQIKNNYVVSNESEKVKHDANIIFEAIDNQKNAIDILLNSISSIKEMSQYFSFLTKRILNNVQELKENALTLESKTNLFKTD
ncbi:MAG: methyl-accepting chemotaxis protein [Spirochaetota bacterium]|nr:methyl-accepting chemotaxis protein [Spirochaetota bacterium]